MSKDAGRKRLGAFLPVFLLFLLLRLWDFTRLASKDEVTWVWPALHNLGPRIFNLHPPAGILSYTFAVELLGVNFLRLFPILFAALAFILMWKLAKKKFGEKAAIWAGVLCAVSYYSVIAAQTIDIDGGIVSFLYLLGFLSVVSFVDSDYRDWKAGLCFGLAIGLSSLFRITLFAIYVPFIVYPFLKRRIKLKLFWPLLIPIVMIGAWASWDALLNGGDNLKNTLTHAGGQTIEELKNVGATLIDKARFFYVLQRKMTPAFCLILGLSLAFAWKAWKRRKDPLISTIAASILFVGALYTLPYGGDKPRYVTEALPLAFVLAGAFLSENLARFDWRVFLIGLACSFAIMRGFNLTEWETVDNFTLFTVAKLALTFLPAAILFLLGGEKRSQLALSFVIACFFAFSVYYSFFASSEKDSSRIVSEFSNLNAPTIVFGEYGLSFNLQEKGVLSGALSEVGDKFSINGMYFASQLADGNTYPNQIQPVKIERNELGNFIRENGIKYLVITKKIIVGDYPEAPAFCSLQRTLERNGEIQGRLYSC